MERKAFRGKGGWSGDRALLRVRSHYAMTRANGANGHARCLKKCFRS